VHACKSPCARVLRRGEPRQAAPPVARRVRRPVPGARRACLRRTCRTTVLRYLAK